MRSELAEQELRRMREAGLERVHFAWAGPLDAGPRALLPAARARPS